MNSRKTGSYFAILVLLTCCSGKIAPAQVAKRNQPKSNLTTGEIAARVKRSLVVVVTQDHDGNAVAQGSGFFIAPNLVATNLHVMKRASQGYVKSVSEDVTYKITEVQAFSLKRDICVLYLADAKGRPLPSSKDDATVGEDILVAGNPEGLEATFSKGIISAIRSQAGLLQIDAPISPGSSGGPVVNEHGEVIGLAVSSLTEGQNLNFAVPIRVFDGHVVGRIAEGKLSVETAGHLAVTDRENEGFHGIVKEFNESEASYTYDEASRKYVRGPAVVGVSQKLNQDGRVEDYQSFYNGQCMGEEKLEYTEDGLQKSLISIACDGKREVHELTIDEGIFYMTSRIHYDETVEGGSKGTNYYYSSKYDSRGLEVEDSNPGQKHKSVMKYDDRGRETEKLEYKDGKLTTATHSTYEVNAKGDWIRKHETQWDARWPSLGFTPWVEQYREITYYGE
jgi:antitoxin component YwqK of YwqJK toxin-antitoxin module